MEGSLFSYDSLFRAKENFYKDFKLVHAFALVQKGTYRQILREEGITQARDRYILYSPVNGVLRRIEKNPGDLKEFWFGRILIQHTAWVMDSV
jgi:hypothetical protein